MGGSKAAATQARDDEGGSKQGGAYRVQGVRGEGDWMSIFHQDIAFLIPLDHLFNIAMICRNQPNAAQTLNSFHKLLQSMTP